MISRHEKNSLKSFWRNNSLSIAMFGLFFLSFIGLGLTGFQEYNSEQIEHQQETISLIQYLFSSHFMEAIFENWESEFLQMWAFVMLTIFLRQKGSPESKKVRGNEEVDMSSKFHFLRENSLGLSLLLLFIISFLFHGISGNLMHNEEALIHGDKQITLIQYFLSSTLWFESFQNWQSEFLSVGALIVLSIFLRQKGSLESKPVAESNNRTGS